MKLLAIDLDGTLVNRKQEISKKNLEALQYAYEHDVLIVPVTGRCLDSIPKQLQDSHLYNYAITSNGARITNCINNQSIYEECMENKTIVSFLKKCPFIYMTCHIENEYVVQGLLFTIIAKGIRGKDNKKIITVKNLISYIEQNHKDIECIQLFIPLSKTFKKVLYLLNQQDDLHHTNSNGPNKHYMEVFSSNTSKGEALLNLAEYLHIHQEDIYCIGDGHNDISMFEVANMSFAVENASSDLKEVASAIVPSNNKDGVAYAIYNYIIK